MLIRGWEEPSAVCKGFDGWESFVPDFRLVAPYRRAAKASPKKKSSKLAGASAEQMDLGLWVAEAGAEAEALKPTSPKPLPWPSSARRLSIRSAFPCRKKSPGYSNRSAATSGRCWCYWLMISAWLSWPTPTRCSPMRWQTPSPPDPAPRPGSTRHAPLKSNFLAEEVVRDSPRSSGQGHRRPARSATRSIAGGGRITARGQWSVVSAAVVRDSVRGSKLCYAAASQAGTWRV